MPSSLDIKRRIRSINSTKKITRAMEMVSAAKMRRAISGVLAIRPYAHTAWDVLANLARAFETKQGQGFLEIREVRKVLMIAVSSNRGLCGSFNAQVARKIKEELTNPAKLKVNRIGKQKIISSISDAELVVDFVTVGKKAEAFVRKLGKNIIAAFPELAQAPSVTEIRPLSKIIKEEYLAKKYDKVVVVYTDYVSAIKQQTRIRQVLPISKIDLEKQIAEIDVLAKEYGLEEPIVEYKVEPTPEYVLEYIFPRLIEMQLLHAVLESQASEHSARMLAMQSATDAASEMAGDLTLAYNQLRQAKITQEIAEISAGSAALE